MTKLYSYVVARDYGFAPNPFYGVCTLATCKPRIRSVASVGDWVLGTGSAARKRSGHVVYAMRVTEAMSFDAYFTDARFAQKKPCLFGSRKQAFGDNIYHKGHSRTWRQLNSHHSHADGRPNIANVDNDTQTDRVLISADFIYWGGEGPKIPAKFRRYGGIDICALRNHKSEFPAHMVVDFVNWIRSLGVRGFVGKPLDWSRT